MINGRILVRVGGYGYFVENIALNNLCVQCTKNQAVFVLVGRDMNFIRVSGAHHVATPFCDECMTVDKRAEIDYLMKYEGPSLVTMDEWSIAFHEARNVAFVNKIQTE